MKLLRKLENRLRGFTGPPGPMGNTGRPGYLQLSGFRHGHELALFDENGTLIWSVDIKGYSARVEYP